MKLVSISLFFCLVHFAAFSQYKQMLHKPYKDKVEEIHKLYAEAFENEDSISMLSYIDKFKDWAEKTSDRQLVLEAELLRAYYYEKQAWDDPEKIQFLVTIAEKGKVENVPNIEGRAVQAIAAFYWQNQDYQKAFKWYMRSARLLDRMEPEDFPNMAAHLNMIGKSYYYFRDYQNALIYFEKSSILKKTSFNYLAVLYAQNSMGLCQQKLGEYERSNEWFLKIIEDTLQFQSPVWIGIASGNLGYNYYLQGDYEKAIPLFKIDIEQALKVKVDYGLAAGSTIPLADIYLKRDQIEKSKQEIDAARSYIQASGQTDRLRKLYPIMSKWFAKNNQLDSSAIYFDSSMLSTKRYNEKYNSLKLMRANQEFLAKDRAFEVSKLKTESRLKISQRNSMIIIVSLLLGGSIITFWFRNKYLLKKQQVKDLALQNSHEELLHAKDQLKNMVQRVQQNNETIIQLKKGTPHKIDIDLLEQLKSTSILTQTDWKQYQGIFKKVYPNFIPDLESLHPDLSPAETRCLCLGKLKMSNNEIALALGVSANTVIVINHRIRKKLGLATQQELTSLIQGLN